MLCCSTTFVPSLTWNNSADYKCSYSIYIYMYWCKWFMFYFERTDLDGSVPVVVEGLLSVLIRSRPQRHHHQVPPHFYLVAPNSDTCKQRCILMLSIIWPHSVSDDDFHCAQCLPSPTVWWTTLSSTFRPSVPKTPMAGEKPSWKAQPWMDESSPETF